MRSTVAVLVLALAVAFIPLGGAVVFAQDSGGEELGGWHGTLIDYSTFWDGKGKIKGQIRLRGESFSDFDFNDDVETDSADDDFFLSRIRVSIDVKPDDMFRIFLQIQDSHQFETDSATANRKGPGAREDRVDIHQAYVDVTSFSDLPLTIRAGRQELSYGSQRLVGAFGWSNVGRTFTSLKAMYNRDDFFLDAWVANVIVPEDRHFNTEAHDDDFFGLYGGWKEMPGGVLEAYFFFRDDDSKDQDREIYTFGTRIAGKCTTNEAVDYSVELVGQLGDAANNEDQEAFAAHFGAGYTFADKDYKPRLGVEYNFSSGDDDPDDGDNNTLDNLYPTNHIHYGSMDRFSWRNMHNIKLSASAKPTEKLTVKCDLHFFWLDDTDDAWYNAGGGVIRAGGTPGADDYVGEELDLTIKYKYNKHLTIMAGYSHFFAEDFVDDTGSDDDADWAFIQTAFNF
jgi:hypothetical protein